MKYRNRSGQITTRDRISIAGVANPNDATLAGIGWLPIVKFLEPEGTTKKPDTQAWTELDGRWVEEWQVETGEEREAGIEAEAEAQAFNDAVAYQDQFARLSDALSVFPGIEAGMTYQQIAGIMDAHILANPDQAGVLAARSLRAMQIFREELQPAGIVNERFWAALKAAQMLGGGQ